MRRCITNLIDLVAILIAGVVGWHVSGDWVGMVVAQVAVIGYGIWCFFDGASRWFHAQP